MASREIAMINNMPLVVDVQSPFLVFSGYTEVKDMADRYLTLREVAAELRVSHETARKAVLDGYFKGNQVRGPGSTWRVEAKDVRAFLRKCAARTQENNGETTTLTKTR
jgi:excisionase family DNA binding protein